MNKECLYLDHSKESMRSPCHSLAFIVFQTPPATVVVAVSRKREIILTKQNNHCLASEYRKAFFFVICHSIALNKPSKCCLRNIANNSEEQAKANGAWGEIHHLLVGRRTSVEWVEQYFIWFSAKLNKQAPLSLSYSGNVFIVEHDGFGAIKILFTSFRIVYSAWRRSLLARFVDVLMNCDTACWRTIYNHCLFTSCVIKKLFVTINCDQFVTNFHKLRKFVCLVFEHRIKYFIRREFVLLNIKSETRKVFATLVHNSIMLIKFMCAQHEHISSVIHAHTHTRCLSK